MTDSEIIDRLRAMSEDKYGLTPRDIVTRFDRPRRSQARALFYEFVRPLHKVRCGKTSRWFATAAAAEAWQSARLERPKGWRSLGLNESPFLKPPAEIVKPVQCYVGLEHRHTVRELPAGYVSQLSADQCRPWAASFGERA